MKKQVKFKRDPKNARRHGDRNKAFIRQSLEEVGGGRSILVDGDGIVRAGNGVYEQAQALGMKVRQVKARRGEIIAVVRDDLKGAAAVRAALLDNRASDLSEWDSAVLREIEQRDHDALAGMFERDEWKEILAKDAPQGEADAEPQIDRAEELQKKWKVKAGEIFKVGEHVIICGDCREPDTWRRLLAAAVVDKVNGVFTSPPYAMQRKEQYGGVPTDQYVEWWTAVQSNAKAHLAADGSFFVNIKPHCDDGQRALYVFDLVLAMVRQWGWRFVDELCWRNTKNGVPGTWPNRLKNAFEPVYHFSVNVIIKFSPRQAGEVTGGAFDYHPLNQKSTTDTPFTGAYKHLGYHKGIALPSNVIESCAEGAGIHQAPFPVALPSFFIRAYSDAGDVWCDPFLGSGTIIVAAANNNRRGLGIEMLEKYVAVCLERMATAFPGISIERVTDGQTTRQGKARGKAKAATRAR